MNDYSFGNFIYSLRMEKGLTQQEIANALDVTTAAVSKWETGASKPRVDLLFRLAELLGVTPEELMAGTRLHTEELDAEAVRRIKENYRHLTLIESHDTTDVKIRRMIAFLIDWNIILYVGMAITTLVIWLTASPLLAFPCVFSVFAAISLRDAIFKGRSIGKRILKLVVIDSATGKPATGGKLIVRDLFFMLMQIDLVVMLVSGKSIGDYAAKTVVVREGAIDMTELPEADEIDVAALNNYVKRTKLSKKNVRALVAIIVFAVIVFIALIFGIVFGALNAAKNTEQYAVAYEYLVSSESFNSQGADEDDIFFNSFRSSSYSDGSTAEGYSSITEISFRVRGTHYVIVCHEYDGVWQVCEECTHFK